MAPNRNSFALNLQGQPARWNEINYLEANTSMENNAKNIPVISKLSRVAATLKHPKMYVTFGQFAETMAFLNGWFSAIARADAHSDILQMLNDWERYQQQIWLALNSQDGDKCWNKLMEAIKKKYPDDQKAFDFMFDELCKFNGVENTFD